MSFINKRDLECFRAGRCLAPLTKDACPCCVEKSAENKWNNNIETIFVDCKIISVKKQKGIKFKTYKMLKKISTIFKTLSNGAIDSKQAGKQVKEGIPSDADIYNKAQSTPFNQFQAWLRDYGKKQF